MTSPPSQPEPPPEKSAEGKAQRAESPGILTLVLHHSITVLILVLVLVLGVWGYLNFQDTEFFTTIDREEFDAQLHPPLEEAQRQRIETALEVHSLVQDRYPNHLQQLVDGELLMPSDLYYPRGTDSWDYDRHSDGYRLELIVDEDETDD